MVREIKKKKSLFEDQLNAKLAQLRTQENHAQQNGSNNNESEHMKKFVSEEYDSKEEAKELQAGDWQKRESGEIESDDLHEFCVE